MVFADSNSEEVVLRPVVEYNSASLRNPFTDLLQLAIDKEKKEKEERASQLPPDDANLQKPTLNLDQFKVQGVIWGSKSPQAIINNKVLGTGDTINGAEIIKIDKNGVTLSLGGMVTNLPTPGNVPILPKVDKEEK